MNFNAIWGPCHERPLVDRVVSTSSWPVPYYNRLFKAYPVRQKNKSRLQWGGCYIDDANVFQAKKGLRSTFQGREALKHVEQNVQQNTYVMIKKDVTSQAAAYVSDLTQFLDVANKENKRILDSATLI